MSEENQIPSANEILDALNTYGIRWPMKTELGGLLYKVSDDLHGALHLTIGLSIAKELGRIADALEKLQEK